MHRTGWPRRRPGRRHRPRTRRAGPRPRCRGDPRCRSRAEAAPGSSARRRRARSRPRSRRPSPPPTTRGRVTAGSGCASRCASRPSAAGRRGPPAAPLRARARTGCRGRSVSSSATLAVDGQLDRAVAASPDFELDPVRQREGETEAVVPGAEVGGRRRDLDRDRACRRARRASRCAAIRYQPSATATAPTRRVRLEERGDLLLGGRRVLEAVPGQDADDRARRGRARRRRPPS